MTATDRLTLLLTLPTSYTGGPRPGLGPMSDWTDEQNGVYADVLDAAMRANGGDVFELDLYERRARIDTAFEGDPNGAAALHELTDATDERMARGQPVR